MIQTMTRKPPEDAETVVVEFYPQVWDRNDYALTGAPFTYEIPVEDAVDDDGILPDDCSEESDVLREHENAPEKAQKWQGPFYVVLSEFK